MSPELHERIKRRAEIIWKWRLHWMNKEDTLQNWLDAEHEVLMEVERERVDVGIEYQEAQ